MRPTSKHLKRLIPLVVLFAICWTTPNLATASGCHYGPSSDGVLISGQPGVFAKDIWWSVGPVRCVYEYGQFTYYQIPTELLPCNGPGCRGKTPTDVVGQPVIIEAERQSMTGQLNDNSTQSSTPPSRFGCQDYLAPSSPVLGGLLKPPIKA
jgi:hypothetical protein